MNKVRRSVEEAKFAALRAVDSLAEVGLRLGPNKVGRILEKVGATVAEPLNDIAARLDADDLQRNNGGSQAKSKEF